jgi:hypothetical protein
VTVRRVHDHAEDLGDLVSGIPDISHCRCGADESTAWCFPHEPYDFAAGDHCSDTVRAHDLGKGVIVAGVAAPGGSVDALV